jgi:predicted enzyme related to lactoylglutathione lyase
MFGLLCAVLMAGGLQMAAAAEGGAPGEDAMDGGGMPQAPAGKGTHPICWLEIQAKDMAASRKFYGEVFGWEITEFDRPDYVMFSSPGGLMGALTAQPHDLERTQGSMATICTQTMDADIAALEALGIEFVEPKTAIGEGEHVAHTAVIRDSAGTLYGLVDMAPELPVPHIPSGLGSGAKPPANALSSIELYGDFAQVKQLFGDLFGWGLLDTMPQYMMFDAGGGIGGVFQSHTAVAHSMPYIYVDDVRAKLAAIVAAGGKQIGEPASMPGMGTFGYFTDPNGVGLGLIGP